MKYLVVFRDGDLNIIHEHKQRLSKFPPQGLIKIYNESVDAGIVGEHSQALYLISLHEIFRARFGISPIRFSNDMLQLGKKIDKWVIEADVGRKEVFCTEFEKVRYEDSSKLKIVFSSLVVHVESINKYFGPLDRFIDAYCSFGVTNGKLLVMAEMITPPPFLIEFVEESLKPLGMKENEDFIIANEQLYDEESCCNLEHGGPALPDCKDASWLESIVMKCGCFVWHREQTLNPLSI